MINFRPAAVSVILTVAISLGMCRVCSAGASEKVLDEVMRRSPAKFTSFVIPQSQDTEQALNKFLWYHFSNRIGNGIALFNKEYLTTADMWLNSAVDKARKLSIQDVHRRDLSVAAQDADGYIHTQQDFSHAHDGGWPFPLWTQSAELPDQVAGKTVGWCFQDKKDISGTLGRIISWWDKPQYYGETCLKGWELHNLKSLGIKNRSWHLKTTGESPAITTPEGIEIDAFQSPFLQLRWLKSGKERGHRLPYVEWMREGDASFSPDRRVYFSYNVESEPHAGGIVFNDYVEAHPDKWVHSMIRMHDHPLWQGKIKRIRIALAPSESNLRFSIDSFFTVYDTRHAINNPIYIFSTWNYFRWTGDIGFLKNNISKIRKALRFQDTVFCGRKLNYIRNTFPGHDGISGITPQSNGRVVINAGHGIGSNYWDLLPFGWDDLYATAQYYACLNTMADLEEAIAKHPEWGIPEGALAFDPADLRAHAAAVKETANRIFWDDEKGRFIACIDANGVKHDYGYTFINLETIWYGLATEDHANKIMEWISGKRIVEGDTSQGHDIYHWRFGPRASTKRNVEWYMQAWTHPESIPWGDQVQDGGSVLGFSFYDLWSRLHTLGPDDAWNRLQEIIKWEDDVWSAGGYREYYKTGSLGKLQGGGTAGGLGIDFEFFESSLLPAIVTYGFLGLEPTGDALTINPILAKACPNIAIKDVLYHGVRLDIQASEHAIEVSVKDSPNPNIGVALDERWFCSNLEHRRNLFIINDPGIYKFCK